MPSVHYIIYLHVFQHLKKYNILCEEQHRFQQNRSCETQLIATVNDIAENMNVGKQTDVILQDFAKAFDKVPHMCLCHKLSQLGINGSLLEWIKNFVSGRTQQVIVKRRKKFHICSLFWSTSRNSPCPTPFAHSHWHVLLGKTSLHQYMIHNYHHHVHSYIHTCCIHILCM